ncbi:DNA repair exonuclease [Pseudoclavibacter chungangensis]|uniref:DNA repair exonuclease n=1 Tax=Pseudoclavibacter chungangensis TaxID=587635 RepID=A0A7J5BQ91_9MICO|nr:metallophosphoesterase [Pseudoclavibacter chungangensis]KAB1654835.1 DNA repair exonuclease [Pseudoclavibacter chungangensis]NYJ68042.1 DNA repair exonuclease SbcCD nuclease subunit [Pseudoclavibacter chungangensis]
MRFIASADWQLGMTAHFLDDDARARYQRARLDAIVRIGEVADEHGAAFVLVCGDVFESNQLDRAILARTFEALRAVHVPVVLLPGNHDPLDASSIYDADAFTQRVPEHVRVLRDSTPLEVVPGVEVVGAPWFSKRPAGDLVAAACAPLEAAPDGIVRVIAGHGAVSTLAPDRDSVATIDVDALRRVVSDGRASFVVLGDRHSTTEVDERIRYPGTPEVTARREEDPGNVLVVDLDGDAVTIEPVHVGRWRFTTVEARLDSADDVDALERRLDELSDKDRTAVWLALGGTLSTAAAARLDAMLDEKREVFARLEHWARHTDLVVVPDGHDFADLELGGFARAALDELVERAAREGDDAAAAGDALGLLYRLAGGAR